MGSGDWTRDVIEKLNNKRQEWESFCPRPMSLTDVDKQVIEKAVEGATKLIYSDKDGDPMIRVDSVFLHLPGLRDKQFPMGVKMEGESGVNREPFVKFSLASPSYWNDNKYYKVRFLQSIDFSVLKSFSSNPSLKSGWVKKIFNGLQDEVEVIKRWEDIVAKFGFHVLPTGFESFLPIGDDAGMFCEIKMQSLNQGMTEIQYVAQGKWSNAEYGHQSEFRELIRRVVNSSPGPELMWGLPNSLRLALAEVDG